MARQYALIPTLSRTFPGTSKLIANPDIPPGRCYAPRPQQLRSARGLCLGYPRLRTHSSARGIRHLLGPHLERHCLQRAYHHRLAGCPGQLLFPSHRYRRVTFPLCLLEQCRTRCRAQRDLLRQALSESADQSNRVSLQQELGRRTALTVNYLGSYAHHPAQLYRHTWLLGGENRPLAS